MKSRNSMNQRRLRPWRAVGPVMLAALMLTGTGAFAQSGPRIGYVDVSRAAARSKTVAATVTAAEDQLKLKQEELELKLRNYQKAQQELDSRRSVLSEDVIRAEQQKVDKMRDDIELMRLEIDRSLRKTEAEVMGPAVDRILQAVNNVARNQGFDLVLRSDVVIYGADTLDITPLVIRELDRGSSGSN